MSDNQSRAEKILESALRDEHEKFKDHRKEVEAQLEKGAKLTDHKIDLGGKVATIGFSKT